MHPRAILLAAAALSAVHSAPAAAQSPAAPAEAARASGYFPSDGEILSLIRPHVDEGRAKGMVVGLLEPDGRRRIVSYGSAGESAQPLGADSVFEIGSINKTFTGAILADMVRRGEVSLQDPVQKYLPKEVRVPTRNGKQITLLDLATHRSGLPRVPTGYSPPDRANPYAAFQAEHLYAFLSGHQLERDIGAEPLYSNLGMGLLGHALARAAKAKSFPALVEERILRPLGMKTTAYGRPPSLAPLFTKGHNAEGKVVPYWDVAVLAGAGGLNSNVKDMLTYLDANLGDPRSPIEQAMRDAQKAHAPGPVEGSGLGLAWSSRLREGQKIVSHSGGTAGYRTYMALSPDKGAGVVVLTNTGGFDKVDDVALALLNPAPRSEVTLGADILDDYPGTYRLREGLDLVLTLENGSLYGEPTGQRKLQIFPEAKDSFFLKAINGKLSFTRDSAGAVTSVTLHQNGRSLTGQKLK